MPAITASMPPDPHGLPTVLGLLRGSGTKAFTVTVRQGMAIQLGCLGKSKDLACVRSPIGAFAVVCTARDESFAEGYDTPQSLEGKFRPGQRVAVRVTAPAGDAWQVRISGGPGLVHAVAHSQQPALIRTLQGMRERQESWVCRALAEDVPICEVSRWLGRKSITTTVDLYGHLVSEAGGRARDAPDRAFARARMRPESAPATA